VLTKSDAADYSVLFDTWLVLHLSRRTLEDALSGTGVSGDDFAFYHLIEVNRSLTPTQIAHWTGMRRSTVTSYLQRMDDRGHIRRVPNPEDGRSYSVQLSGAGRRTYNQAVRQFDPALALVEEALGVPDQEVRLALERLDGALRHVAAVPPRPYTLGPTASPRTQQRRRERR
jgi:DNA-binding MarR family transcriptional regulator